MTPGLCDISVNWALIALTFWTLFAYWAGTKEGRR